MSCPRVALVGMPNVGKTALFNKLTGSHQRVANFPGITVEKKVGWVSDKGEKVLEIIDLPGLYSLDATTLDEKVTKDFLLQKEKEQSADLFVLVLDATNLDKSLFLAFQLRELGYPLILVLNLIDEARRRGLELDIPLMEKKLGAVIIPTSGATGEGVETFIHFLKHETLKMNEVKIVLPPNIQKIFRSPSYVNDIFRQMDEVLKDITIKPIRPDHLTERIDHYVLHPFWGAVILIVTLLVIFQTLFSWSAPLMDGIEALFGMMGEFAAQFISHDLLRSLVVDGIIGGVGGVLVFLPQILLLFLFINFLEDLGYLGRAAFMLDSLMRKFGLPGKAVIPLLSSHACAIPGILATRVIDNYRERLITMLVIPLTTCSARLPVYAILIAALVPNTPVFGFEWFRLPGLVLFGLYALGFFTALIVSIIFKKTLPHQSPSMLLMELPPYRLPKIKNLLLTLMNKGKIFLTKAGTVILGVSILLWVLMTFPQQNGVTDIEQSYAASMGRFFEPVFRPLGFDWRMTTALIPSIAAREVVVSSLSMVLSIQEDADGFEQKLTDSLLIQFGAGPLMALLVWFVFAPQCISTFAVMKRETNSWRWPIVMVTYTLVLAYVAAWIAKIIFSQIGP